MPDGALDYVPFSALELSTNPASFVVLHHDVALTPAAWMYAGGRHDATHGTVDTRVPEVSALMLGSYDARGELIDGAVRVSDLVLLTPRSGGSLPWKRR